MDTPMKSFLTLLLGLSFISIAVFGFFTMLHVEDTGHKNCISEFVNDAVCPNENAVAFAAFHLGAFKQLTTSLVMQPVVIVLAFAFLAFAYGAWLLLARGRAEAFAVTPAAYHPFYKITYRGRGRFLRWLSLHENRPAAR